ncbi:MAG: hypothetical protein LBP24_00380 [Coriobacteriales bacterium]|jgi:hypothetical protein|nr:hypothetical protein [Coriobacteriales bacterium]
MCIWKYSPCQNRAKEGATATQRGRHKHSCNRTPALLATAAEAAVKQIRERNYAAEAPAGLPVYLVGIGFLGKTATVLAEPL